VIAGAGSARPVQVLGRCATRSAFDQQSDRVGPVLLPGGEARIAAGKCLDLGAVGRGDADTSREGPLTIFTQRRCVTGQAGCLDSADWADSK
jgi:hypothetical protein